MSAEAMHAVGAQLTAIYTFLGATFFWVAAAVCVATALAVAWGLYTDRARIRWPWQSAVTPRQPTQENTQ